MEHDILAGKIMLISSAIAWVAWWIIDYMKARNKRQTPRENIRWTSTAR